VWAGERSENSGGGEDPKKSPLMKPLGLSKEEKAVLKEFLAGGAVWEGNGLHPSEGPMKQKP
jgi:hypothetical protein